MGKEILNLAQYKNKRLSHQALMNYLRSVKPANLAQSKNLLLVQSKRWGFNYFSSMAKGLKKSIKGKLGSATKKALAYAKQNAGKALKQAMKVAKAKLPKNAK